ncbi:hypothetical protein SHINM1_014010 [Fluviibacter phosphoraccumulans]|nr:hypothetical protein SHINM1_014010 [Fluviibacter phosphoraccumulans]
MAPNLIAFDPPRINAGCGGIDLYGGSFSFINKEQLIALMRATASNAAGLLFKAAIQAVSPQLSNLMTEFGQLVQNMNNLAKNSCALAQMITDTSVGGIKSMFVDSENAANANAQDGTNKDIFDGLFNMQTSPLKSLVAATNTSCSGDSANYNWAQKAMCGPGASKLPGRGNPLARAFQMNALEQSLQDYSFTRKYVYDGMLLDIIQSMFSFTVTDPNQGATGKGNYPRSITLNDVVNGGGPNSAHPKSSFRVTQCQGNTSDSEDNEMPCTSLQTYNWGSGEGRASAGASVLGVPGYVNTIIFGDPQGASGPKAPTAMIDPAQSLIGYVTAPNSSNLKLTAEQVGFINGINLPILSLLKRANGSPEALQGIGTVISEYVQDYLRPRYARLFVDVATTTFTGIVVQRAEKPTNFDTELAGYQNDLGQMERQARRGAEALTRLNEATEIIFKNMPALARSQKVNSVR